MKQLVHHARAAGVRQKLRLIAEQPARRHVQHHSRAPGPRRPHLKKVAFTLRKFRDDDAGVAVIDVDDNFFDRLQPLPGLRIDLQHDLRTRYRQLEAFAPHVLDEDSELQFAAARDDEAILVFVFLDADRDVALGLFK